MSRRLLLLFIVACGGASDKPNAPVAETCRVQLPPRTTPLTAQGVASPVAAPVRSRLVADVEVSLAQLVRELETNVPIRVDEQHNQPIGIGSLNYVVDRGPFKASISGDNLIVQTDIRSHAEACRGNTNNCFASCDPTGKAVATISLRVTPDYKLPPSRVVFNFTRGCEVRALGGLMKIDVTPQIQQQITPTLRRVERDIDSRVPPIRPRAEQLWAELGKTRPLPLGACAVTNPEGLVQGPMMGPRPDIARLRFGILARPEIRRNCGGAAPPASTTPLPPLAQDPQMPAEDDVIVTALAPLGPVLAGLEGPNAIDVGGGRARVAHTTTQPAGSQALVDLQLRGEICGDAATVSSIAWTDDGKALRLATPAFTPDERQRLSAIQPDTLARSLSTLTFAPPIDPESLKEMAPALAKATTDPHVDVNVRVTAVKPLQVLVRNEDLAASMAVRASLELRLK